MRFLKKELKQLSYPSKEKVVKVTTITLFSSIILAEEQNKKMIHLFSENEINTIIGSTHSQKEIINRIRRFK